MFYGIFFVIKLPYNAKKRKWSRTELSENNINISQTNEYKNNFIKNNYDRINIPFKKGTKDILNKHIKEYGYKSVSFFVNEAVQEKIQRDLDNNSNN